MVLSKYTKWVVIVFSQVWTCVIFFTNASVSYSWQTRLHSFPQTEQEADVEVTVFFKLEQNVTQPKILTSLAMKYFEIGSDVCASITNKHQVYVKETISNKPLNMTFRV